MLEKIDITTLKKGSLIDITQPIRAFAASRGVREGIVTVSTPDGDTGILITSFCDPRVHEDIIDDFTRIFPARDNFHCFGGPTLGAAHSKAAVAGQSVDMVLSGGELRLGHAQGVFFAEYSNPGDRSFYVSIFGE